MKFKSFVILSLVVVSLAACKKDATPSKSTTVTSDDFKTNAAGWTI